ncbi:UDP-N-acetylmuramoyl-tripeptide--D-alanyl-D-alanine ligase [Candidatus Saccharibacteria bacterium]|nr:UDP-N-acetylmuramoyl-tripeptide--D-alanyl-D-alanine ligase [Candidatus Saccharibacteria bacterium]
MKKLARRAVAAILGYQVRRLCKKNQIKVIGVVGSIGKTSTKLAIASVLKAEFRVQYQTGNYNDLVSVPLVFFGGELPSLFSPMAWLAVFRRNQTVLRQLYPYDVVVLELGSDAPGQISQFKKFLKLEIGVVTAITPEHMAFFGSLDEVAKEELAIDQFSSLVLANKDLCDDKYLKPMGEHLTYGMGSGADYKLEASNGRISVSSGGQQLLYITDDDLSKPELYSMLAAVSVAYKLGMQPETIEKGLKNIKPVNGRMQKLAGINSSIIIDDSYNSSPEAVKMALDALYKSSATQKIALLGSMNELGAYSETAHTEIGTYCDPVQLDSVVTIGKDANQYLAKAAELKGCKVHRFDSPYQAGEFIKSVIKPKAAVLVKGSQNGVFAEEAIKPLLANPDDQSKLVRQSAEWLKIKEQAFKV